MTSEQVWGLQQLNKNLWEKHSKQKNNKYKVPREEAPCVCVSVCVCVCVCVCVSAFFLPFTKSKWSFLTCFAYQALLWKAVDLTQKKSM